MKTEMTFASVYSQIVDDTLTPQTVRAVFDAILSGEWSPIQVGAFVASLRLRGESAETITAAASAMRAAMVPVEHELDRVLDTCGTGGDGQGTLNLSTGAAVIAAAAGVAVAKHGNRAVSSRTGSADVVEALGIPTSLPARAGATVLREANIAFLLAPTHHPAMRHAAEARRELGIRTLFNCLGPLANPARATHQLVGAYEDRLRGVLAKTLRQLGTTRAWVVHAEDGLDEISPFQPTRVSELSNGEIREFTVTPEDFGLPRSAAGAIRGGDAAENARVIEDVLGGSDHPSRDAFILNGAAALVVALGLTPSEAADRARQAIESGAATRTLSRWRSVTRAIASNQASS